MLSRARYIAMVIAPKMTYPYAINKLTTAAVQRIAINIVHEDIAKFLRHWLEQLFRFYSIF